MITNMKQVAERLNIAGIKPSVQRLAIMNYLMNHKTHPTVEEIYAALSPEIPTLSKTTVYNTLKLLTEHSAILMLTVDEYCTRYDADISDHAHFICSSCGKVYDLEMPTIENLKLDSNFQTNQLHLYVKGVCAKCRNIN
jgi:Fur family ferric uptake transcriptional regulator/Fur family peroxide stress response transcriptional regulator